MVSVIVPARDAEDTLGRTLHALGAQRLEPGDELEVIVSDDGSRDATAELAAASPVVARVVRGPPGGPAEARNRAAAVARGRVLAFTDADCEPTPGWAAAGLRALAGADLVQGAVRPRPDVVLGPFDRTVWVVGEALYETASLFVRRDLFERLGGFEGWLRPVAGKELAEDVWLGWRARRAGARTAFCAQALVHHAVFPRRAAGFVAERRRLEHFPAIAARVPELRQAFFYRRWFLSRRSAALDLALAGAAAAAARRRGWPLLAALPYARLVWEDARRWGPRTGASVAVAGVAADLVGAAALARGSVAVRSPLL